MNEKIRIRLLAYDYVILDRSTKEIVETAKRTGGKVRGPIPLPTDRSVWTVNRSPHVDKKSMDQFEMRTHNRLLGAVPGCDGLKTGYFTDAGFSIAATAQRDGARHGAGARDRQTAGAQAKRRYHRADQTGRPH